MQSSNEGLTGFRHEVVSDVRPGLGHWGALCMHDFSADRCFRQIGLDMWACRFIPGIDEPSGADLRIVERASWYILQD